MERYYHFLEEDKFMRKRGVLAAMLTGVMLVLCGCGGMTTDEAKDYVKSALDAGYKAEFKEYAAQVIKNAKALETALKEEGFRLVADGTDNHGTGREHWFFGWGPGPQQQSLWIAAGAAVQGWALLGLSPAGTGLVSVRAVLSEWLDWLGLLAALCGATRGCAGKAGSLTTGARSAANGTAGGCSAGNRC